MEVKIVYKNKVPFKIYLQTTTKADKKFPFLFEDLDSQPKCEKKIILGENIACSENQPDKRNSLS